MEGGQYSGKWATETFDFLRLFQRIGKRFTGLLLLELGWSVLLLTVKKITPTLAFPILMRTVPFKVQTLTTGFVSVDVVQVLSVGGIIIFLFWIWYGGFYRYLSVPLIWLTRTLFLSVLTILVALVALALNISFLKDRLEKPIVLYYQIVKKMISIGRVAIAPIHSYTFDEEVYAAKAPLQTFAAAINKVTHALGYLRTVKRVRFNFLPDIFGVSTPKKAGFFRKLFGSDVFLWGSYISIDPPKILINIETKTIKRTRDESSEKQNRTEIARFEIFPHDNWDTLPTLVVDQRDPMDAYILMLLTVLQIFWVRANRKRLLANRHFFRLFWRMVDIFSLSQEEQDEITLRLIKDALFSLSNPVEKEVFYVSAKETLLNIASDWAIRRFDDIFGNKKYRSEPGLIESIINKCVTLGAETQVNYYRLAFLRCLADDKDGALKWLKKAEESEHPLFGLKGITVSHILVSGGLSQLTISNEEAKITLAKAAIFAAKAAIEGDKYTSDGLLEDFMKSLYYQYRQGTGEPSLASERLFFMYLGVPYPW